MEAICADLAAEHAGLDAVVADLDPAGWATATPAEGWDVRATIVHIAFFDDSARLAVVEPAEFERRRDELIAGKVDVEAEHRHLSGAEVLAWWRTARGGLLAAMAPLDPKDRIVWYGPPMSARSFATARLMETWSHGQDAAAALGRTIPATDRLRHIAHLGVVTRGWSYANRGRQVPDAPVRVELVAPSGDLWEWGLPGGPHSHTSPDGATSSTRTGASGTARPRLA